MIIHDEAVKKVLMDSGWNEERNVDITEFIEAYNKYGYDMPDKVKEVLSAFGGLTLKIPDYRYQYYCEVTGKTSAKETDLYTFLIVKPDELLKNDWDRIIKETRDYTKEVATFYKLSEVYPIGFRSDYEEEYYIGENGELIDTHEDMSIRLGNSFEEGIKRIMTDKDTDMEYFSEY